MSSILDALNKLEEERAAQQRAEAGHDDLPAMPEDAAAALLGLSPKKVTSTAINMPMMPIVSVLFAGIVTTALFMVVLFRFTGGEERQEAVVSVATEPAPMHAYTAPLPPQAEAASETIPAVAASAPPLQPPPTPVESVTEPAPALPPPAHEAVVPAPMPPAPSRQVIAAVPPPPSSKELSVPQPVVASPSVPVESVAEPAPASVPAETVLETVAEPESPAPAPIVEPAPPPVSEEQTPEPPPAPISVHSDPEPQQQEVAQSTDQTVATQAPSFSTPVTLTPPEPRQNIITVDVDRLERLSANDRAKLGLDSLRLNVLREASSEYPDGMAIINLKKIYVGELIPGTRVRLIGVSANGIGVEVEDTRERYRIPR